jgi:rubrerythrin
VARGGRSDRPESNEGENVIDDRTFGEDIPRAKEYNCPTCGFQRIDDSAGPCPECGDRMTPIGDPQ